VTKVRLTLDAALGLPLQRLSAATHFASVVVRFITSLLLMIPYVRLGGEVGQVEKLVRHLSVGLWERQRVV
jgi:hypothetical protein